MLLRVRKIDEVTSSRIGTGRGIGVLLTIGGSQISGDACRISGFDRCAVDLDHLGHAVAPELCALAAWLTGYIV